MAKPHITIRAETRLDKTITVYGIIKGGVTSATIELPAAAEPAGATSRPQATLALNSVGEFSHAFLSCPYGFYAAPKIVATNADGETVAHGWPIQLFAPGTAPIGTPRALLPPFVAPAFTAASVAIGAVVTDFTLESTSPTDQANVPFTFGQPFKSGELAPGDFLIGRVAGQADIPLQLNFKASHPNGSIRHAIISGVLPALAAGASRTVQIVRASSGTSTAAVPSKSITDAGFSASITITTGGIEYTADATAALAAGMDPSKAWFGGAIATDYIVNLPFTAADGAQHLDLTAQFSVRYYPGTGKARVDVVIEHTKAYTAASSVSYSGTVTIGGRVAMTIAAFGGGDLVHFPAARWKRTLWWGHNSPVHLRHNVAYLLDSRAVSNYQRDLVFSESMLSGYETLVQEERFHMMGSGLFAKVFAGTGGRPELGLASAWYIIYLLSQDRRAKRLMHALAECAGSWSVHRRDMSNGPAGGLPMDVIHYPRSTILGTGADSKNTATGGYEKIPSLTAGTGLGADTAHQSAFAYIPYLVSGDHYYLEELHFWAGYNLYNLNPGVNYRSGDRGLVKAEQVRGQAWSMRTLGQGAAVTPDGHYSKPSFHYWLQNNLSNYNSLYTDNPDANQLGIIVNGPAIVYTEGGQADTGISNFMDDFFMQAMGHVAELGFPDAQRFARWKAKWQVSRLIGEGTCYDQAAFYSPMVRLTSASPLFTSIAEVAYNAYLPEYRTLPCGSQERLNFMNSIRALPSDPYKMGDLTGYPKGTEGYPSVLQTAVAYAVDVGYPDADLAWMIMESRPTKPNYASGPQFAITPRGYVAPEVPVDPVDPTDPVDPPDPDPLPFDVYVEVTVNIMFIGKAAS